MSADRRVHPYLFRIIGGLGLFTLAYGAYEDWVALSSVDWPSTEGRIVKSSVISHTGNASLNYQAYITYRYQVDGRVLEGQGVHFHDHYSKDRVELQVWVDRFPAGSSATVHYEPGWPHRSVLVPGLTGDDSDHATIMTGLGMTLLAGIASVSSRKPVRTGGVA